MDSFGRWLVAIESIRESEMECGACLAQILEQYDSSEGYDIVDGLI
jgi:hypothetical protein